MPNNPSLPKQRLVIFLDGTWNTEDDGTNILQAHALTKEGLTEDGFIQKRYYDRGVGTGLLDSIVGGGFGVGLEVNVREAYNWLVDNYHDGEYYNDESGDEIYIFGFSRGAYSARSLVGFIATCGLLRRGAPLTNSQLWNGYVQISRHKGHKNTWWGSLKKPPFRRITEWIKPEDKNLTEKLLDKWSRRVNINYLGVFDTVGAMGLEALGIQGIRSKSGMNHNQNPTSLILKCRHALAIDENRASFKLTRLLNYVVNPKSERDDTYDDRIYHKWFVGAHSDIGGGYNDNLLASYPLKWIMDGAMEEGLKMENFEPSTSEPIAKIEQINDSYLDFTGLIWPHILREKRYYRQIDQPDIVIASWPKEKDADGNPKYNRGFTLVPINEEVDQSVIDMVEAAGDANYAPPNLINYARRVTIQEIDDEESDQKKEEKIERNKRTEQIKSLFKDRKTNERWLGTTSQARIILVLWSMLAAFGVAVFLHIFLFNYPDSNSMMPWPGIASMAFLFVVIDVAEFHFNLKSALNPAAIINRVLLNFVMWFRLVGILFFFIGVIAFIHQSVQWGRAPDHTLHGVLHTIIDKGWHYVPLFAIIAVLLVDFTYNGWEKTAPRLFSTILSPIVVIISGGITYYVAGFFKKTSVVSEGMPQGQFMNAENLAGQLIIIQLLLFLLYYTIIWVGKPIRKVRFENSTTRLQFAFPEKINSLFEDWKNSLIRNWIHKDQREDLAWSRAKEVLRESLWRDIIGFVPIYTFVFGAIMWIGSTYGNHENWSWLSHNAVYLPWSGGRELLILPVQLWVFLIALAAIGDYIENFIHLGFIQKYPKGKASLLFSIIAFIATTIKFVGFILAFIFSMGIFINVSINLFSYIGEGGWRWIIANVTTLIIVLLLLSYVSFSAKRLFAKAG